MSQSDSPVRAIFDAQRMMIKQNERAFKQGLTVQRTINRAALHGLKRQETLQRQGLEFAQAATRAYMGAVATMTGTQQSRKQGQNIDETFSRLKETHAELFDVLKRELDRGVTSFDELSDEYIESLDQQTDQLLETHQIIEDQTAQNFDEFSQTLREQLERTQELQDQFEDQFEEQSERTEKLLRQQIEQAENFQRELENEAERTRNELRIQDQQNRETRQDEVVSENQLELIDGLGSTFRERLNDVGINSIDDLVQAGPDTVAEAADVSKERAEKWVEQARS